LTGTLPLIVAIAIYLAVLAVFIGLYRFMKPAGEVEDRLREMAGVAPPKQPRQPLRARLANLVKGTRLEERLGRQFALELTRGDLPLTVSEYVLLRLGAGLAGFLVGSLLMRNLLLAVLLTLLGLQLPVIYVQRRRSQRQRLFQNQLVDVLSMLVSGLRAGVGLVQAMDMVRREMPPPAGQEFGRVVREISLGASQEEALDRLLERMPGDDLSMIITVIKIQSEVGGNLADVLDQVIETIRERVRIAQEIRTLTAQQRLTGYILAGLPFLVGAAIMMINPDFMRPLFTPQWIWLPGMALVMILVGFVVIRRIVDIKV